MTARDGVRGLAAGVVGGTASGLFGVGGGLAIVPALTAFFGTTQHQAHGTSLAVICVTAVAAVVVYGAHANVVWSIAAPMALGSLVSAPLGARLASKLSATGLRRAFAVFLVLVALRLLWEPPEVSVGAPAGFVGGAISLLVGLVAGVVAGFMGVGGGILVVPFLTLVFGLSQQAAQGTSLAVMLVTAPMATWEHTKHGNVVWRLVPLLAVGTVLAAPGAAWIAQRLSHTLLTRAFAVFLLATAAHSWLRSRPHSGGEAIHAAR